MKKFYLIIPLILLSIITQVGCVTKEPVSDSGFHLNTMCEITIYDKDEKEAREIIDDCFGLIDRYERKMMSKTTPGSDIYRINHSGGAETTVNSETSRVIRLGLEMGDISDGKFDITLGNVSSLWNFTGESPKVPDSGDIEREISQVDYHAVKVDGDKVTVNSEAGIDLGGIAKGYIADAAGKYLKNRGVKSAVINLGGNVVAIGSKGDKEPWTIGIERPFSDRTEVVGAVKVKNATIVTSGIYERKFKEKGKLYHHVLDPETGYPAKTDLEAVTIVAKEGNSAFCDGLSTSCLLLGKDRAQKLISDMQEKYPERKIRASFIDKNNRIYKSKGMKIEEIQ